MIQHLNHKRLVKHHLGQQLS